MCCWKGPGLLLFYWGEKNPKWTTKIASSLHFYLYLFIYLLLFDLSAFGVAHFHSAQSLSGKWRVVPCAHALAGINIKAQKWRYTAASCTPVRPIHTRFNVVALRLYGSKFGETCAALRPPFLGLCREPRGAWKTHMGPIKRRLDQFSSCRSAPQCRCRL